VARRPLSHRVVLWHKRLRTARSAQELLERYLAALRACELSDWRSERAFLRLMQRHIKSEGGAALVLRAFRHRPDVQKYIAKLILRRVVDPRMVAAVERVLFGSAVNWNEVDIALSEIDDAQKRVAKLREYIARAPDDPNGTIRLVKLLVDQGQTDEALAHGRRLREQGILTVRIARELGDVLARAEQEAEAVRTYSEIVEFDPLSTSSRRLLGDIYLGRGWYEPAYRQYKTVTEAAADDALGWLRLSAAAAGAGRVDEALRLERRVATAQGRPGPADPRRWARLLSASRLGKLMAEPPKDNGPSNASLEHKLKELQLFRGGPATLVLLTWEDLGSELVLRSRVDKEDVALGELTDAAPVGLSAALLSPGDLARSSLVVRLRTLPREEAIRLVRCDIVWDGKGFQSKLTRHELPARKTKLAL